MNIDDCIKKYEYIIHRVAHKYLKNDVYDMYKEDFSQIGRIALWNAIKKYDKEKNDNFEAYAYLKVKNAFLDEIKKLRTEKRGGNCIIISINAPCNITINGDSDITLQDVIEDKALDRVIDIRSFLDELTEDELAIIKLKTQNKTVDEIKKITGFSKQKIVNKTQCLKRKLKENVL